MTNGQLFKYHQDIQSLQGSILEYWFQGKIKEFYKHNGIRIRTLSEKINALAVEYFEMKDGQIMQNQEGKSISKDGKDPNEYKTKMDELMKIEVNIIL